jgi:hypothetical protein
MKLVDTLQSLLRTSSKNEQVYVSLFLDVHRVSAAFWRMGSGGKVEQVAHASQELAGDNWKERTEAVDSLLGALEEKSGLSEITTTILGLPSVYLTSTGEIQKEIRHEVKILAKELDLKLAGFVPLSQAVIFKLKTDEGVPPSVILLGINTKTIALSLYKIGTLVDVRDLEKHDDIAASVESGLKSFTQMEVLPARILLYGATPQELEDAKASLLHHPWTTKANFLHFPKIDIISAEMVIHAISLAGASELSSAVSESQDAEPQEENVSATADASVAAATVVPNAEVDDKEETVEATADAAPEEDEELEEEDDGEEETATAISDEDREVAEAEEVLREDFAVGEDTVQDANVVMVDAASLGFKKHTEVARPHSSPQVTEDEEQDSSPSSSRVASLMATARETVVQWRDRLMGGVGGRRKIPLIPVVLVGILLASLGIGTWVLPRADVTVFLVTESVTATETITIDPTATAIDGENMIVPGKSREQAVSGEKTVAVNGVKEIGDPAKGTVTIYNKSLSSRTFKKGAQLSSGALKFTLDADVNVASASESVGSITFGKADAAVTAVAIGIASNLAAESEFTFADVAASVATARNEAALAGGTSKEVTVVSRADVDNFIKDISTELTQKAKQDLSSSVEGGETLIEDTIKTVVTERVFDREINQEATELNGKVTITVSGIAYSQGDIEQLFVDANRLTIPSGYIVDREGSSVKLDNVKVEKDGTITARATVHVAAKPMIDSAGLPKGLSGKSIRDAESYLRGMSGVGGMEVRNRLTLFKNRLPVNPKNISITLSVVR